MIMAPEAACFRSVLRRGVVRLHMRQWTSIQMVLLQYFVQFIEANASAESIKLIGPCIGSASDADLAIKRRKGELANVECAMNAG